MPAVVLTISCARGSEDHPMPLLRTRIVHAHNHRAG
jgi:hypothetical protein